LIALMARNISDLFSQNTLMLVFLHLSLFFFSALLCHQQLADSKPQPRKLTEFYLIMSLGGALGGFFNAIIAPLYLIIPLEYALVLLAAALTRYSNLEKQSLRAWRNGVIESVKKNKLESICAWQFLTILPVLFAVPLAA